MASGYFHNLSSLTVKNKGPQDVVCEAHLNTELLIKSRIAAAFPEDAFLDEETGVTAFAEGQGIWVVDPIDGTQTFVSGMSNWCVSIAFVRNTAVQFGPVHAPERNELFAGGQGIPATLNGQPVPRHPGKSLRDGITGMGYNTRLAPPRPFRARSKGCVAKAACSFVTAQAPSTCPTSPQAAFLATLNHTSPPGTASARLV